MKRNAIVIGIGTTLLSLAAWAHWGGGYGGYGPGMMGGYGGYGGGMMGGYFAGGPGDCFGYGRGDVAALGLTDQQRDKIGAIERETWEKQARLMDRMHDLRWNASSDTEARKAYAEMSKLRQEMFDNSLDARKRFEAVLTAEQKRKLTPGG